MVYSIADSRSFGNISGWLRSLATHADSDVIKMLIGNKCDLEVDRVISQLDGEQMAANYGIKFFETSAKLNINVDTIFFEMAGMINALMPAQPEIPTQNLQVEYFDGEDDSKRKSCCFKN
uniref:Uncharacterized protein n=1 Tax=Panagrolaimus davidi TaxID=227884 RepID=A0A914PK65_9BILA